MARDTRHEVVAKMWATRQATRLTSHRWACVGAMDAVISHDHEVRTPQRGFDVTSSLNVKISVNSTMDIQPHGASDVETHDSRAQLAPSRQEKWKMPGDKRFEIWIVNGPIPVVIPEPVKP